MKNSITITVITLLLMVSCSTPKPNVEYDQYENCLPTSFGNDLNLLVESFNEFVKRNYNGETGDFISAILKRDFPEKSEFITSDSQIATRLRTNNFREYIYTEYEENFNDSGIEIAPPRTANESEEPKRTMIKVDIEKPYLKCLNSISTNGKLIKEYVKLQTDNPSLSPLIIGDLFLNNKTDKDNGTKLANTIIAVELYYMIMDAATKQ